MDARRREWERKAKSGDDDGTARGRLLSARLRAGEIERERVELLAYLGYPAAIELVGARKPATKPPVSMWARVVAWIRSERNPAEEGWVFEALGDWVVGLRAWGEDVAIRACVEALAQVSDALGAAETPDYSYTDGVAACRAWIDCPCDEHTVAAIDAQERLAGARGRASAVPEASHYALACLDHVLSACAEPAEASHVFVAVRSAAIALGLARDLGRDADPALRRAVCTAMHPWALR